MNGGGRGYHDPNGPGAGATAGLDAYVDGLMSPAERDAFERRLAVDPALSEGLATQRRLDRSLCGLFAVPPFIGLPTNGHPTPDSGPGGAGSNGAAKATATAAAAAATVPSVLPYNLILGALAAIIVSCVSWLAYTAFADPRRSFEDVYKDPVVARAIPSSCGGGDPHDTPAGETACTRMLGGLATMRKLPAGVEIIGIGVEAVLSKQTLVMRAKVDGRDVVVFADTPRNVDASAAKSKVGRRAGGLNVFLRQGNGLLLYEISPFDTPRLLDLYDFPLTSNPDKPSSTAPAGR